MLFTAPSDISLLYKSGRKTVATLLVCCMELRSESLIQRSATTPSAVLTLTTLYSVHMSEPYEGTDSSPHLCAQRVATGPSQLGARDYWTSLPSSA